MALLDSGGTAPGADGGGRPPERVVAMAPTPAALSEGGMTDGGVTEVTVGRDCTVQAWPTIHRVPSQGYSMWRTKRSLRPELAAEMAAGRLSTRQIAQLRRDGAEVETSSRQCVFAFSGDTTLQAVLDYPPALEAEALVLECTYFDAARHPVSLAHERGHVHLSEIAEAASRFRNRRLVLMHFSAACKQHGNALPVLGLRFLPLGLSEMLCADTAQEIERLVGAALPDWLRARTSLAFNLAEVAEGLLGAPGQGGAATALRQSLGMPSCC